MPTRRETLSIGMGGVALAMLPAMARALSAEDVIQAFTGGAPLEEGDLHITIAEIAENGSSVPVVVEAPEAEAIVLVGPRNRQPEIFEVKFGPLAGTRRLSTRIRLAESQEIIAVARLADGRFIASGAQVSVTLGGCVA